MQPIYALQAGMNLPRRVSAGPRAVPSLSPAVVTDADALAAADRQHIVRRFIRYPAGPVSQDKS